MKEGIGRHIAETRIGKYVVRKNREYLIAERRKTKALEIESKNAAIIEANENLDRLAQSALDDLVVVD